MQNQTVLQLPCETMFSAAKDNNRLVDNYLNSANTEASKRKTAERQHGGPQEVYFPGTVCLARPSP